MSQSDNRNDKGRLSFEQRRAYYEASILDTQKANKTEQKKEIPAKTTAQRKKTAQPKQEIKRKPQKKQPIRTEVRQKPQTTVTPTNIKQFGESISEQGRTIFGIPKRPADIPSGFNWRGKFGKVDFPLFTLIMVLLAIGLVMMFSASYAYSLSEFGNSFTYISRQLFFAVIGLVAMYVASKIDYHLFMNHYVVKLLFAASVVLMLLVLVMGTAKGGAVRWISIFGIEFQPSEIMKFALIIMFAYLLQRNYSLRNTMWHGFFVYGFILGFVCLLTIAQPHLSGTLIMFALGITLMYVGECNRRGLILMIVGMLLLIGVAITFMMVSGIDYFGARWLSFTNPFADTKGDTYQTYQSLVTIGSGGMFGLGLGNSRQKYFYLPESQNDFVFSIVCEELGFVGAMVIILLFILLVFRGLYVASKAKEKFGTLVATGLTVQIGLQALLNIAVVTNAVPNTGISLPFFSYGGTALVMQLAQMGVLLSISRQAST